MHSHEELQNAALQGAQILVETWSITLEGIEGMVRQTVQRGFTEREARAMVAYCISGGGRAAIQ